MERIPEEEEFGDTDDATSSVEDPGESSHRSLSAHTHHSPSVPPSHIHRRSLPRSPAHTRSNGKAKR